MAGTFDAGQEYNGNISSHRIQDTVETRSPLLLAKMLGYRNRKYSLELDHAIKILTRTLLTEKNNVTTIPTILVCNIRSLFPKIDELGCVINLRSADVICVIETWLSGKISGS